MKAREKDLLDSLMPLIILVALWAALYFIGIIAGKPSYYLACNGDDCRRLSVLPTPTLLPCREVERLWLEGRFNDYHYAYSGGNSYLVSRDAWAGMREGKCYTFYPDEPRAFLYSSVTPCECAE